MADTDSDSDSFHSFHEDNDLEKPTPTEPKPQPRRSKPTDQTPTTYTPPKSYKKTPLKIDRFPPSEEATLLSNANTLKTSGNQLFGKGNYSTAIQTYDRALASCPNYLDYELAVLRSNIAACHIKLEEWKEAIESAEKGVACLERLEPLPEAPKPRREGKDGRGEEEEDEKLENGVEEVDEELAERLEHLEKSGHTLHQIRTLQTKLLLRRATARSRLTAWSSLQGADEDYRLLLSPTMQPFLSPTDKRNVTEAAQKLLPRLKAAQEAEMAEMMGKLKGLGNSILKPFGLSTENFQFVKDEKTGGYSMNFEQNPKKG